MHVQKRRKGFSIDFCHCTSMPQILSFMHRVIPGELILGGNAESQRGVPGVDERTIPVGPGHIDM
jgi:hypothetical protein